MISCLNKNVITHFVWHLENGKRYDTVTLSIDRLLKKGTFLWENHAENARKMDQKLAPDQFLILVSNQKQPLHARNSFKS